MADKTVDAQGPVPVPPDHEVFPYLVVLTGPDQGAVFPLGKEPVIVGRDEKKAQIVLTDPGVSRAHALFFHSDEGVVVEDLGSTNGVTHGREKVKKSVLASGDTVALSHETCLRLSLQDEGVSQLMRELYQEAVLDTSGVLTRKSLLGRLQFGSERSLAVMDRPLRSDP